MCLQKLKEYKTKPKYAYKVFNCDKGELYPNIMSNYGEV